MVYYKDEVIYSDNNLMLINGDCMDFMERMADAEVRVDTIITSPFYNTNAKAKGIGRRTNQNVQCKEYHYIRYDYHVDNLTSEEYARFSQSLFEHYDKILSHNGVVLYNLSFGSEVPNDWIMALNAIVTQTNFTLADVLIWKKKTAFPNSSSSNKTTRICEFIFVLCRKSEILTFKSNKKSTSKRDTGQKAFENIYNFIEARNNDGPCPYNKATYSSELVEQLIDRYVSDGSVVFDSFCGSGTTLVACYNKGIKGLGCEISLNQCNFAKDRIEKVIANKNEAHL
jgi:DNA modification methylase